ncbi:MAG: tetratricopeptide repeat protein, partial [Terriglobia bacterium]
ALTGRHPFLVGSFMATSDRILHQAPPPLTQFNPRVPTKLEDIVAKMLAKDPGERYATAADLVVDLHAEHRAAADMRVDLRAVQRALAYPALRPTPPRAPRRAAVILAGAALVVLLAVVAAVPSLREQIKDWLGIVTVPEEKHLAVLPFQAVGDDPQTAAFTDGLTATLTAKLAQLTQRHPFQVVPSSEVRKQGVTTAEEARKEFGVNLVLEGSLRRAGERVRVNYALVDATTRRQLRTDTITAPAANPFAVEDQVVASVLDRLEIELQPQERRALAARGTQVAGAYAFYLQGRGYLRNYHKPENIENAISVFQRALGLDPNYALAYAGLGEAYLLKHTVTKWTQWVGDARRACEQALTLDAKLVAARICLGNLFNRTGEYEQAVAEFQLALESEPTSDDAYGGLAQAYEALGKLAEAEQTYRRAIELRPHYWAGYSWLCAFYVEQARYEEAAEQCEQAVALTPDNVRAWRNLGGVYYLMGRNEEAEAALQKAVELYPEAEAYSNLGMFYLAVRRFEEAVATLEKAFALGSLDYSTCGNLARAYYWALGKRTQARETYERCVRLGQEQLQVNPRDAEVHILLASYFAMLAQKPEAFRHLERALSLRPDEPEYLFWAAVVHNQFGERAKALARLERAVAGAYAYSLADIRAAIEFDNLRDDPKFQQLIRPK